MRLENELKLELQKSGIIDDVKLVYDYSIAQPRKFEFMYTLFKDKLTIEFMANVVKYEFLAMYYYSSTSKKYLSLDIAISNTQKDNLLIYFDELNAYAVFDNILCYEQFLENIMFSELYPDSGLEFSPYQIIFAEIQQKVVILIKGTDKIAKDISSYAKIFFDDDIILNTDVQTKSITIVNLYVVNLNEAINRFNLFHQYLHNVDKNLADYIASPIENVLNGVKFVSYYVGNKSMYGHSNLYTIQRINK